jgi:hypothetical protein
MKNTRNILLLVNIAFLFVNVFYILNPQIPKPKEIIDVCSNNIFKVVVIFGAYFVASYSIALAIQMCVAVLFIDFDYKSTR